MSANLKQRLNQLNASPSLTSLAKSSRGIEKEALRVDSNGAIAQSAHPQAMGSALSNPYITTDFSEALLEFITPVCGNVAELMQWLTEIHQFSYSKLENETLWAASMPCVLPNDTGIPLAQYGSSNIGQMKTVYRDGLGHRYGRAMQTIAGIHYNFSFSEDFWDYYQDLLGDSQSRKDFKTEQYFHLIRNFRRYSWLLIYLFGASPALCKTFIGDQAHKLTPIGEHSLHEPHGTSLRMGDMGYQSNAQSSLYVCYNGLDEYAETLSNALNIEWPAYKECGTHKDGKRIQLNTALLQIENEFYSSIRPKRVGKSGETPLNALVERGVEYIEVRCLDINPYLPLGIDADQVRFVDAFLLFCLLQDSPPCDETEYQHTIADQETVVTKGRHPDACVHINKESLPLPIAAQQLLDEIQQCSLLLDKAKGSSNFSHACEQQQKKLDGEIKLPSAQILDDMAQNGNSYFALAMAQSKRHQHTINSSPLSSERQQYFEEHAKASLQKQKEIEQGDEVDFETFLANYYAQS